MRITPGFVSKQLEDGRQPLHGRKQTGREWDKIIISITCIYGVPT